MPDTVLTEGDPAPDFALPRDGGDIVKLSDFADGALVIFFYPRDDTSGCTKEAVGFTAAAGRVQRHRGQARKVSR